VLLLHVHASVDFKDERCDSSSSKVSSHISRRVSRLRGRGCPSCRVTSRSTSCHRCARGSLGDAVRRYVPPPIRRTWRSEKSPATDYTRRDRSGRPGSARGEARAATAAMSATFGRTRLRSSSRADSRHLAGATAPLRAAPPAVCPMPPDSATSRTNLSSFSPPRDSPPRSNHRGCTVTAYDRCISHW